MFSPNFARHFHALHGLPFHSDEFRAATATTAAGTELPITSALEHLTVHGTSALIDIETLDQCPRSVITEIGIIIFDRYTFEPIADLDLRLDIFDQIAVRSVSQDTIDFHRKNDTLPKLDGGISRFIAGAKLTELIDLHKPKKVWIQGPCFERPIIEDVFRDLGQPLPWPYHRSRDCRTNWDTAFPDVPHPKRPHHALADAYDTLKCLEQALTALNRRHAC